MDSHLIRFQEKKFLFLDFETFNLNLNNEFNLPWQVATLLIETVKDSSGNIKNAVRDRQDLYIKWDTNLKIGEGARRITGYSETKFKSRCIPQEEAFKKIYNLCEECDYIVGHNVLFVSYFVSICLAILVIFLFKKYEADIKIMNKDIAINCFFCIS